MFDLTVLKYNRVNGKEIADLPGLFTAAPPRRPARGRERDLLVLMVQFDDRGSLFMGAPNDMLEQLGSLFFATRGTVTTALKAVTDQLNEKIMARNLKSGKDNAPILGLFIAAVLHDDMLFLAHAGPMHSYLIGQEHVEHFSDPAGSGRGLGVSRTPTVRYFRQSVQPGDMVLLSSRPPENWTDKNLQGSAQLSIPNVRRRLLTQAGDDVCFSMLRFKPGLGIVETNNLTRSESQAEEPTPSVSSAEPPATPVPQAARAAEGLSPNSIPQKPPVYLSGKHMAVPAAVQPEVQKPKLASPLKNIAERLAHPAEPVGAATVEPTPEPIIEEAPAPSPRVSHSRAERQGNPRATFDPVETQKRQQADLKARSFVASGLNRVRIWRKQTSVFFAHLFSAVVPGQTEKSTQVSTGAMVFIAIAVPLMVAAVGTTVYFQSGNSAQRSELLAQAMTFYKQAESQSDSTLKRVNLQAAIDSVEQAAEYGNTAQVVEIRDLINEDLDVLDGIRRLDMSLAAAISADNANFTRVVASSTEDLYLLDATSGSVARLVYARPSYKIDNSFKCGPNMYGGIIVSPLVDITLAPAGNALNAVIMGVDAYGNILYCSTNPEETSAATLIAPDAGWGKITAIHYQNSVLDVLDTESSAVWRYNETEAGFNNAPRLFFRNDGADIVSTLDISLYQDDLYMLNTTSQLTLCTYNNIAPSNTRCQFPYAFNYNLSGQEPQTVDRLDAAITQIVTTEPPEPSIFLLDSEARAVYQFSLGMNFVRKISPNQSGSGDSVISGPVTAFTITNARSMVLVIGNRIYTAELPSY